jgi:abortive infection bacteriophage resistance protein
MLSLGGFLFFAGGAVKFTKPPLTFDQQVQHLQVHGMGGDPAVIKRRLEAVNYYRLSAYWHTFRTPGGGFIPNTDIDVVWERYAFDREMRLLVLDAIERFEVAVRTRLAYAHAHNGGAFGYLSGPSQVWAGRPAEHQRFVEQLEAAMEKNKSELFVQHFNQKYSSDHPYPPIWVAVELLMFGDVVRLFNGSAHAIQKPVADFFGVAPPVMKSWLLTMNVIRNICAHHGRLWNRQLGIKPMIPRSIDWDHPVRVSPDRSFGVITILAELMHRIARGSRWPHRLRALVERRPDRVPIAQMGFPSNWTESAVWARALGVAEEGA